ncbi:unnamed protein product [Peniophora sp. CBMAI 1063]|nr:unnamed protein product [Peniophora sp. CBMAI 1063]
MKLSDGEPITPYTLLEKRVNEKGEILVGSSGVLFTARAHEAAMIVKRHLYERRPPCSKLDPRFVPGHTEGGQVYTPPLVYFGFPLTLSEIHACVKRLNLAPSLPDLSDLYPDEPEPEETESEGRNSLFRSLLVRYLKDRCRQPFLRVERCIGSTMEECWIFTLYANTDLIEGFSQASQEELDVIAAVLRDEQGCVPQTKWCWDYYESGYDYSAPWDDYNLWPVRDNKLWRRDGAFNRKRKTSGGSTESNVTGKECSAQSVWIPSATQSHDVGKIVCRQHIDHSVP